MVTLKVPVSPTASVDTICHMFKIARPPPSPCYLKAEFQESNNLLPEIWLSYIWPCGLTPSLQLNIFKMEFFKQLMILSLRYLPAKFCCCNKWPMLKQFSCFLSIFICSSFSFSLKKKSSNKPEWEMLYILIVIIVLAKDTLTKAIPLNLRMENFADPFPYIFSYNLPPPNIFRAIPFEKLVGGVSGVSF